MEVVRFCARLDLYQIEDRRLRNSIFIEHQHRPHLRSAVRRKCGSNECCDRVGVLPAFNQETPLSGASLRRPEVSFFLRVVEYSTEAYEIPGI
jgi:hypothetical protein